MGWRQTGRPEVTSTMQSCESADCNGRKGRAVGRGSCLRYASRSQFCHQGGADDAGRFALISCHSKGCVAFEMLSGAEPLALSQCHVVVADVILQVNERLPARAADTPKR